MTHARRTERGSWALAGALLPAAVLALPGTTLAQFSPPHPLGPTAAEFEHTMSTGITPLFTAIVVATTLMLVIVGVGSMMVRPRIPRFPREA